MEQLDLKNTIFDDVFEINSADIEDERGFFRKFYSEKVFLDNAIDFHIYEVALIRSKSGVLRGLHVQNTIPQPKIVSCIEGKLWMVILCVDTTSDQLGKWTSVELTPGDSIYVSGRYAVGSLAMVESLFNISYGSPFIPEYNEGILWNDKELAITWPSKRNLIVAEKDKKLQCFSDYVKRQKRKENNE